MPSTASRVQSSSDLTGPPADLQLTNWPVRDDGISAWTLILGAAGLAALAGYVSQSALMGSLSFAALAAAMWRMWVPVRCEFGPKGILLTTMGRRRRIAWSNVRRHQIRSRGVVLLTSASPVAMAVFTSIYIRWRNRRDALVALVEYYLGARTSA